MGRITQSIGIALQALVGTLAVPTAHGGDGGSRGTSSASPPIKHASEPPNAKTQTKPDEQRTVRPRNPVLLVHGFKDTSGKMQTMASFLRKKGWTVYTPTLAPSFGQVGIDELARQLSLTIDHTFRPGEKFDLVGFSMGGIVCRYYVQRMGGMSRVDRLITLGAPHHGSLWACLIPNVGCRQMRPGSSFLNDLNRDSSELRKIKFTSIWSPLDLMIVPATSSRITDGQEVHLWIPLHPLLVWSPLSLQTVAALLADEKQLSR